MMDSLLCWFWLCTVSGMGAAAMEKLVRHFSSIEQLFLCSEKQLEAVEWLDKSVKARICVKKDADAVKYSYEQFLKRGYHFICADSPEYPSKLKHIYEYPKGLFYAGKLIPENMKAVAVVGARYCTQRGREIAAHFGRTLSAHQVAVISGMALGIDGAAHRGCVEAGGNTCAVLGCGLNICYPKEHYRLFEQILSCGCVMTEYPPDSVPQPWHFPRRNRIISGLSDGVLVIEAKKRSGSLITAEYGLEQGKDIFAVPGRPKDPLSEGCNNLIKAGAQLVCEPEEVLEIYGIDVQKNKKNNFCLDKSENLVYSTLCLIPKYIDEICGELDMAAEDVISILYKLQARKIIRQTANNQYVINQ